MENIWASTIADQQKNVRSVLHLIFQIRLKLCSKKMKSIVDLIWWFDKENGVFIFSPLLDLLLCLHFFLLIVNIVEREMVSGINSTKKMLFIKNPYSQYWWMLRIGIRRSFLSTTCIHTLSCTPLNCIRFMRCIKERNEKNHNVNKTKHHKQRQRQQQKIKKGGKQH